MEVKSDEIKSKRRRKDGPGEEDSTVVPQNGDVYVQQDKSKKRSRASSVVTNPTQSGTLEPTTPITPRKGSKSHTAPPIEAQSEPVAFWDPGLAEKEDDLKLPDNITLYPINPLLLVKQDPPLDVQLKWDSFLLSKKDIATEMGAITQTMQRLQTLIRVDQLESYYMGMVLLRAADSLDGTPKGKRNRVIELHDSQGQYQKVYGELITMAESTEKILNNNVTKARKRANDLYELDRDAFRTMVRKKLDGLGLMNNAVSALDKVDYNTQNLATSDYVNDVIGEFYYKALVFILGEAKKFYGTLDMDNNFQMVIDGDDQGRPQVVFALVVPRDIADISNDERSTYKKSDLLAYLERKLVMLDIWIKTIPTMTNDINDEWWVQMNSQAGVAHEETRARIENIAEMVSGGYGLSQFKDAWKETLKWFRKTLALTRIIPIGVYVMQGMTAYAIRLRELIDAMNTVHNLLLEHTKNAKFKLQSHLMEMLEGDGADSPGISKTWDTYLLNIRTQRRAADLEKAKTKTAKEELQAVQENEASLLQLSKEEIVARVIKAKEEFDAMVKTRKDGYEKQIRAESVSAAKTATASQPIPPASVAPVPVTTESVIAPATKPIPPPVTSHQDPKSTINLPPSDAYSPLIEPPATNSITVPPPRASTAPGSPISPQPSSGPNSTVVPLVNRSGPPQSSSGPQGNVNPTAPVARQSRQDPNDPQVGPSNPSFVPPSSIPPNAGRSLLPSAPLVVPLPVNDRVDSHKQKLLAEYTIDIASERAMINKEIDQSVAHAERIVRTDALKVFSQDQALPVSNDRRRTDITKDITRIQNDIPLTYSDPGTKFKAEITEWEKTGVQLMTFRLEAEAVEVKQRFLEGNLILDKVLTGLDKKKKVTQATMTSRKKAIMHRFAEDIAEKRLVHEKLLHAVESDIKQVRDEIASQKKLDETIRKETERTEVAERLVRAAKDKRDKEIAAVEQKKAEARKEVDAFFDQHVPFVEQDFKQILLVLYQGAVTKTKEKIEQEGRNLSAERARVVRELELIHRTILALNPDENDTAQLEYDEQQAQTGLARIHTDSSNRLTEVLSDTNETILLWNTKAGTSFRSNAQTQSVVIKGNLVLTQDSANLYATIATALDALKKTLLVTLKAERKEILGDMTSLVKDVADTLKTEITGVEINIKALKDATGKMVKAAAEEKKKQEKAASDAKDEAAKKQQKIDTRKLVVDFFESQAKQMELEFHRVLADVYQATVKTAEDEVVQSELSLAREVDKVTQTLDTVHKGILALDLDDDTTRDLKAREQRIQQEKTNLLPGIKNGLQKFLSYTTAAITQWNTTTRAAFQESVKAKVSLIIDGLDLTREAPILYVSVTTKLKTIQDEVLKSITEKRDNILTALTKRTRALVEAVQHALAIANKNLKVLQEDITKKAKAEAEEKKKAEQAERDRLKKEEKDAKEKATADARAQKEADARSIKEKMFDYKRTEDERNRQERKAKEQATADAQAAKERAAADAQAAEDAQHAPATWNPRRIPEPLYRPKPPPKTDE